MRKVYLLMAVAAIMVVGCKNIGSKKAAQEAAAAEAAAEEAAAEQAERINKAIEEVEASENMTALEAVEALSRAQVVEGANLSDELAGNPDAAVPFAVVEEKPTFNGGDANDFSKWVSENIVYPEDAKNRQVSGRVILQFTVNKDGEVKDVQVVKGVDPVIDAEAVRVVSASPKWTAGNQAGIPVNVRYIFPVVFKLN